MWPPDSKGRWSQRGVMTSFEESHSIFYICFYHHVELKSVFEGSTTAGSTNEIFEQVAVNLPESSGLGHLCQVIDAELKAELFQVLNNKRKKTQTIKVFFILSKCSPRNPPDTLSNSQFWARGLYDKDSSTVGIRTD